MARVDKVLGNGECALKVAMRRRFDLIVMDINLPEMNGLEATRRTRQLVWDAGSKSIFAFTASAFQEQHH